MAEDRSINLNVSNIARADACPGSAHPLPGIKVEQARGDAAKRGSAVHEIAARIVAEDLSNCPEADGYAFDHGVIDDLAKVQRHGIFAAQAWQKIRTDFDLKQGMDVERYLRRTYEAHGISVTLRGYADALGMLTDGITAGNIDWKSGSSQYTSEHQTKGYLMLLIDELITNGSVAPEQARQYIVYLEERWWDSWTYTVDELRDWWSSLMYRLAHWDGETYVEGDHCTFCPYAMTCQAHLRSLHTGAAIFAGAPLPVNRENLPADRDRAFEIKLLHAYHQARAIVKNAEVFLSNLRREIQIRGGIILEDDPGKVFSVSEVSGGWVIKMPEAWDTLRAHLGPEEAVRKLCSITKSAAVKAVRETVPRGEKQEAEDALMADLVEAGAAYQKPSYPKFSVKKVPAAELPAGDG